MVLFTHKKLIFKESKKQHQILAQTAYYQAGKIVVQTILPEQSPVALITLNTLGTTCSTSADTYIPIENISNTKSCSSLESRLVSLYGGKAASLLIEYQQRSAYTPLCFRGNSSCYASPSGYRNPSCYASPYSGAWGGSEAGGGQRSVENPSYYKFSSQRFTTASNGVSQGEGKEQRSVGDPMTQNSTQTSRYYSPPASLALTSKGSDTYVLTSEALKGVSKDRGKVLSIPLRVQRSPTTTSKETPLDNAYLVAEHRTYFAGANNNIFQSTLGNMEIQTATRLARIMVNYWNFYSLNKIFLYSLFKKYIPFSKAYQFNAASLYPNSASLPSHAYVWSEERPNAYLPLSRIPRRVRRSATSMRSKDRDKLLCELSYPEELRRIREGLERGKWRRVPRILAERGGVQRSATTSMRWRGNATTTSKNPKGNVKIWSNGVLELKGKDETLVVKRQTLPRILAERHRVQRILVGKRWDVQRFASMRGGVQRSATTTSIRWGVIPNTALEGYKVINKGNGNIIHRVMEWQNNLDFALAQSKNSLKICENKNYSSNIQRFSAENIVNYSQLNNNNFQLINSLQFSNLQRDRFYPNWFRLYLPDMEATEFLKNLANYYFSLGLQTLTFPSTKSTYYSLRSAASKQNGDLAHSSCYASPYSSVKQEALGPTPFRILAKRERACVAAYAWGGKKQRSVEDLTRYAPSNAYLVAKRQTLSRILVAKRQTFRGTRGRVQRILAERGGVQRFVRRNKERNNAYVWSEKRGKLLVKGRNTGVLDAWLLAPRWRGIGVSADGFCTESISLWSGETKKVEGVYRDFTLWSDILRGSGVMEVKNSSFTKIAKNHHVLSEDPLNVPCSLLLENQIFPLNYNGFSMVEKELLYNALVNSSFAKAFYLINQNRQLLDFFVDYLLRFQILRQHQILFLFSTLLLGCNDYL